MMELVHAEVAPDAETVLEVAETDPSAKTRVSSSDTVKGSAHVSVDASEIT